MSCTRRLVVAAAAGAAWLLIGGTPEAQARQAAASSQWGPGYGAVAAADGMADDNGNYWQTVRGQDRGAWWQLDLGEDTTVRAVKIAWARWEDKVHCPPAEMVIQISPTGAAGTWKDARRVRSAELPRDGQPYDEKRQWLYALPQPVAGRFVRLLFPEGAQPGARHPGYLCLGEVEVPVPRTPPRTVTLEGGFGRAEI